MRKLAALLNVLFVVAYPMAVYFGLTRLSTRSVGLLLIVLLLPAVVGRLRGARREDLTAVAALPVGIIGLIGLGAALDDRRFMLALPVLINLFLLAQFGLSLRRTPMVERFARLQDPELGPAQVGYCRTVTGVWCIFFALNAAITLWLLAFASVAAWALYTGLVAYVLIGTLGAAEYLVRKYRFREYGPGLHDRLIARVFPPRAAAEASS